MKYKVGQRVTVNRPRAASFKGTISRVNKNTVTLTNLSGPVRSSSVRVSLKALEDGRVWFGKPKQKAKPKAKQKAKLKKAGKLISVRVLGPNRRSFYKSFPKSVVPSGLLTEAEGRRMGLTLDEAFWSHFTHGGKTYLGRFFQS